FTSDPTDVVDPVVEPGGAGSLAPRTVGSLFREAVQTHGSKLALCHKPRLDTPWKTWTYAQYWEDCVLFAKAVLATDIEPHAVVNILGFNSPEWFIASMGSVLCGTIAAGIYATSSAEACRYISGHSKAKLVVVDGNEQLKKYVDAGSALPDLKAIVVWGAESVDLTVVKACAVPVFHWEQFLRQGVRVDADAVAQRWTAQQPGHCVSLIYTSGTTGAPKAVMLSHDNVTWTCQIFANEYVVDGMTPGRIVSYLPLSHVAAQMIDIHYAYYSGSTAYFAQPDALKGSLSDTLKEVRPTVFFGVPRVWEKMEEKLKEVGRSTTGLKKTLSAWAKSLASTHCEMAQFGNSGSTPWGYSLARLLVLRKIKEALGLDQCRAFFTAAAPIAVETLLYFASLDIPVYELYGQSECTGPHTSSKFESWKYGYCGRPLPGTYTQIDQETKELKYRGRHIFMGYMHMPDATAATFDEYGFLRSGDIAEFDNNDLTDVPPPSGFMKITGRIKEIIITAGGENIPPVLIESAMKVAMPALSTCLVIGDRRKYLVMLVSLKCSVDKHTGEPTDELASDAVLTGRQIGSTASTMSQAAVDPLWIKYIDQGMSIANSRTTSRAQVVQKWKMLPVDLSEKQGHLTPTLKIKRAIVDTCFSDLIDSMYV
ncbi:unnamed protein product, partial [Ectocarpus fasciculatus]